MRLVDPLRHRRDEIESLAAEFEALRQADSSRLQRMKEYRDENASARFGAVNVATESFDYGSVRAPSETPRHHLPLPLGKALNVKHTHRISGRLPDAIVDRREENAQERYRSDTMEKMWWSRLHDSGGGTLISSGAWDASEIGAACYAPYWDVETQLVYIQSIDPAGVLAVPGIDNPHKFQRVYRFWQRPIESVRAEYRSQVFDGSMVDVSDLSPSHSQGDVEMVTLVELDDGKRTVRFAVGPEGASAVPLLEREHGNGFVGYVVIPNIGPERDVWGWADYEFVRSLVAYIPALLGREADILRAVANGAYYDSGSGQDANAIKAVLANGGVLPGKREGDVRPIDTPEVPAFAEGHRESVMELFKMLGFAPDASWGSGNTRSGTDRGLQLQPLLELTAMKQENWSSGLSRLASMIFRMTEKRQRHNATYRGIRPGTTGRQASAFKPFQIGANLDPTQAETDEGEAILLPRTPKELFDGDYSVRFVFQNRIDPDDPAFVLGEVNKFVQGVQSLETTLDRLGFQAPEDEMKRIEQEADRMPWLRQGMIALTLAALKAQEGEGGGGGIGQGMGGGAPTDVAGGLMEAFGMTQKKDGGALGADAATRAIPGATGKPYGGA